MIIIIILKKIFKKFIGLFHKLLIVKSKIYHYKSKIKTQSKIHTYYPHKILFNLLTKQKTLISLHYQKTKPNSLLTHNNLPTNKNAIIHKNKTNQHPPHLLSNNKNNQKETSKKSVKT
jgi:hypothetical protein